MSTVGEPVGQEVLEISSSAILRFFTVMCSSTVIETPRCTQSVSSGEVRQRADTRRLHLHQPADGALELEVESLARVEGSSISTSAAAETISLTRRS